MKRLIILMIAIFALTLPVSSEASGADATYGPYTAQLVRVLDGDTVEVKIALLPGLTYDTLIRLNGINAPEIHTRSSCEKAKGMKAKAWLEAKLSGVKTITVTNVADGKYAGRLLGTLVLDGQNLDQAELAAGLAHAYHGGKRKPFCGQ